MNIEEMKELNFLKGRIEALTAALSASKEEVERQSTAIYELQVEWERCRRSRDASEDHAVTLFAQLTAATARAEGYRVALNYYSDPKDWTFADEFDAHKSRFNDGATIDGWKVAAEALAAQGDIG